MLEVGEYEGRLGYWGGLAGAGGDVLEGAPALAEQGESAFAEAAKGSLERVPGAVAKVEVRAVWACLPGSGCRFPRRRIRDRPGWACHQRRRGKGPAGRGGGDVVD